MNLWDLRRGRWQAGMVQRAAKRIIELCRDRAADESDEDLLAREFLLRLEHAQDEDLRALAEAVDEVAVPQFLGELLPVVVALGGEEPLVALRALDCEPVESLARLLGSLTHRERTQRGGQVPSLPAPIVQALRLLARIKTPEAIGCLVGMLGDSPESELNELVQRELGRLGGLVVGPALVEWPWLPPVARRAVTEVLGDAGVRDERFFAALIAWLDESPRVAAYAVMYYGDARGIGHLRRRLEVALDTGELEVVERLLAALHAMDSGPTPQQRDRLVQLGYRPRGLLAPSLKELRVGSALELAGNA